MKALLVYPEFPDTYWSFSHALRFEGKRSAFPPLGLLTVSALLPESWERRLVDMNVRKLKTVVQKHGGRNFKYYASMTSGTPNRLFMYEIDKLAHFDTLSTDPDFRAVKLDSLYTDATGTTWAEVPL